MEEQIALGGNAMSRQLVTADEVSQWRDHMFRLALAIIGDRDAAEDVAQETISRAIRSRRQLQSHQSVEPWIRKICVRQALNHLRSRSFETSRIEVSQENDETTSIAVRETLRQLTPDQSAILALFHFERLSYEEIARTLDVPVGTVASRLNTAKNAFKQLWEENDAR